MLPIRADAYCIIEPEDDRKLGIKGSLPMPQSRWARLQIEFPCPLRRGAWYRVLSASPLDVVVDVNRKQVRVPRRNLELSEQPASRWTVIETGSASVRVPKAMSVRYAVCPGCRERVPLGDQTTNLRCPKCNGLFDVAWPRGRAALPTAGSAAPAVATNDGRRPRTTMPTMPRHRGSDRRQNERRQVDSQVTTERRSGAERRRGDRRKKGPRNH